MPNRKKRYKDMERFRETRYSQRKRYYAKTAGYTPHPWTLEEDKLVLEHSVTDTALSQIIGRSVSAIQHRRCRLKKASKKDD